jgi:transcriptional regulator with XRE-family HTH domain
MIAIGTYIRTLREAKRMSRGELGSRVNTSVSQLVRLENGEQDTRSVLLAVIVKELEGDFRDVSELLLNEQATAEDGKRMARERIQKNKEPGNQSVAKPAFPTTALAAFLIGLHKIEALEGEYPESYGGYDENNPYSDLTEDYMQKIDRGEFSVIDIIVKLRELEVTDEEIAFLIDNPDLPASLGDRLAATRLGFGTVENIIKRASINSSSNDA